MPIIPDLSTLTTTCWWCPKCGDMTGVKRTPDRSASGLVFLAPSCARCGHEHRVSEYHCPRCGREVDGPMTEAAAAIATDGGRCPCRRSAQAAPEQLTLITTQQGEAR